jgi:hypothetical protein
LNTTPMLALAMLAVGGCEILFHWLLGRGVFPSLLAVYLSADAGGKYFLGGIIDNVAPAMVLGCVNGWVGYPRWSVGKLSATALALAVFVVALMPLYRSLIGPERFAMIWDSSQGGPAVSFSDVFRLVSAFLAAGASTHGAYVFRRDWKLRRG